MLEYIRKHVTTWPEGADGVWLCSDGEIVFDSLSEFDFYPVEPLECLPLWKRACRPTNRARNLAARRA